MNETIEYLTKGRHIGSFESIYADFEKQMEQQDGNKVTVYTETDPPKVQLAKYTYAIRKSNPALSYREALDKAFQEHPELFF